MLSYPVFWKAFKKQFNPTVYTKIIVQILVRMIISPAFVGIAETEGSNSKKKKKKNTKYGIFEENK